MGDTIHTTESRRDLEARVLAAALKQSFERGDMSGALLAHRQLTELLKQQSEQPQAGADAARQEAPAQVSADGAPEAAPAANATNQVVSTDTAVQPASGAVVEEIAPEVAQAPAGPAGQSEPVASAGAGFPGTLPGGGNAPAEEPAPSVEAGGKSPETPHFESYYHILGLEPVSPFERIRIRFLSQVKRLLRERATNKDLSHREFRDRLRTLCVAYDVLRDPNTRTDYDFRLMGLRGGGDAQAVETPTESEQSQAPNKPHLRIGELLQCSEILEPTELEIAVDMHKAMPEMPFGQFLVKQGFLTESELYSALLGQRLIIDGKITVAQFQTAMYTLRERSIPLSETLVSRGWVGQQELESVTIPEPRAGTFGDARSAKAVHEVPVNANPEGVRKIAASNAVPSWAGQIDWADSAEAEAPPVAQVVVPGQESAQEASEPASLGQAAPAGQFRPVPTGEALAAEDLKAVPLEAEPAAGAPTSEPPPGLRQPVEPAEYNKAGEDVTLSAGFAAPLHGDQETAQAAAPTLDQQPDRSGAQAPPPVMCQPVDVGRDPVVRTLQEQLAAIHRRDTLNKVDNEVEEESPEFLARVEALEPEAGSQEGEENAGSEPGGLPAESQPHVEQIEEEPSDRGH